MAGKKRLPGFFAPQIGAQNDSGRGLLRMDGEDPRPTAVILSEAKDLGSCPCVGGKKQLPGFFAPQIGAQNDRSGLDCRAMKDYYVYIMTNNSRTLYTGVTNNIERRVYQHKHKLLPGFTEKYNLNRLVYYECCGNIRSAIEKEKQIKGWVRAKKVALIISVNPAWKDLSEGWFGKDNCLSS
jgi:putative endonuclease